MSGLSVLHIVKRYGPVGGMERYVWELTRELARNGHRIGIVCEKLEANRAPDGVEVHELGRSPLRPRWFSHLIFSRKVHRWLRKHASRYLIIHSHERSGDHHITTFHGPPFARVLDRPWWKLVSWRTWIHLWLEKREVCADHVHAVVPNSGRIARLLEHYYPCIGKRLADPIPPGVRPGPGREERAVPKAGGVIGFVGKEWRRKGLELAVEIVKELRKSRPGLEFWIAGPKAGEVRHLFSDWHQGYRLLGEVDSAGLYPHLDLLLHPAREEPYGMVIAEAVAAGVPAVLSSRCGVADEISRPHGVVLDLDADPGAWVRACENMLSATPPPAVHVRTWQEVARSYEHCYRTIRKGLD